MSYKHARMGRGRPSGHMTKRRQQVLQAYTDCAGEGRIRWAELSRRCGLYSFRDAQRIVRDLQKMGAVI